MTDKQNQIISLSNLPSIIIAVVLIVGIGAVYGLIGCLVSGIKENVTPVIQVPIDKSDLDKSDWEVYRNEEFGFEIKYPKYFRISENNNTISLINFYDSSQKIEILRHSGPPSETMDMGEIKKESVIINGITVNRILMQGILENNQNEYYLRVFISEKNIFYHADFKKENLESLPIVFDQILSTFKFIEEDETADWKTYRNEKYGFEVEYPNNWIIEDMSHDKYPVHSVSFISKEREKSKLSGERVCYCDIQIHLSQSLEYLPRNQDKLPLKEWLEQDGIQKFKGEEIKISGVTGYVAETISCDSDLPEKNIFLEFEGRQYHIVQNFDNRFSVDENNQILSTFKFIEKDETADWKTYRNEEYGFELKYPGDWDNPLWQENEYRKGITFGCPVFDFEGNEYCSLSLRISEAITKSEAIRNISINIGAYKKEDVIINEGGIPTIKEFTVDTREAITYHDAGICVETYTKIFDSKMTISFTDRCSVYEGKIFDQILSTFKFIEEDETADWQTYRNEEFGFEIKYLSEWKVEASQNSINVKKLISEPDFYSRTFAINILSNIEKLQAIEWAKKNYQDRDQDIKIEQIGFTGIDNNIKEYSIRHSEKYFEKYGPPISEDLFFSPDYSKVFIYSYGHDPDERAFKILSTFKFIEKDETADGDKKINHLECSENNPPSIYDGEEKGYTPSLNLCGEKTEFPAYEFEEENFILFTDRKSGDYGAKDRSLKTISTKYPFEEKILSNEIGGLIFSDFDLFKEAGLYFAGIFADGPGSGISVFMFKPESKDFIYFVRNAMLDVDIKIASSKSSTIFNAEKKARRLLGENEDSLSDNDIEIIINNERLSKEDVDNGHLIKDQEAIFNCRPPGFIVSNDYYNHPDRYFDSYGDMVDRGKINIRRYVEYFPDKFPCFVNEESDEITGYFDLVENKFVSVSSL